MATDGAVLDNADLGGNAFRHGGGVADDTFGQAVAGNFVHSSTYFIQAAGNMSYWLNILLTFAPTKF